MNKIISFLIVVCCSFFFYSCEKELSVESFSPHIATGSLWDSAGNCLPDSVHGTFYTGVTPRYDTAYVEVEVNVTQTGSYSIVTQPLNGMQFIDSGYFTSPGLNVIRLKPIGTPTLQVPTTYAFSFDSTSCNFTIDVQDSTGRDYNQDDTSGTGGDTSQVQSGQWQFAQGTAGYGGTFDSVSKDNSSGAITFVHVSGASSTGDTTMMLEFSIPGSDIKTGTYTMLPNTILFASGDVGLNFGYSANAFVNGAGFTVTVTSYNASTKEMKATFSGNAQTLTNTIVPISNGSIDAVFP